MIEVPIDDNIKLDSVVRGLNGNIQVIVLIYKNGDKEAYHVGLGGGIIRYD